MACEEIGGKSFTQEVLEAMEKPKTLQEIYTLFPERFEPVVRGTVYRLMNRGDVKRLGKGWYVRVKR